MKKQTTNNILAIIRDNGGFDNFNRSNRNQIEDWVKSQFNCSNYIAKRVSEHLFELY